MLKKNKKTLILTSIITVLPVIAGIVLWNKLPDSMAIHFGVDNKADGFGSKIFAVFGLPIFLLMMQIFCAVVISKDPRKQNISNKLYTLVLWIIPLVSIITNILVYTYNLGVKTDIGLFMEIFIGFLFIVLGNYLPKIRQNYTLGIKLPWTLANEENWNKTHRLAGIVYILMGIFTILMSFNSELNKSILIIVLIVMAVLVPGVYSFILHLKRNM